MTWGGTCSGTLPVYSEAYSYTVPGEMSGKTLTVTKMVHGGCVQALTTGSFTYDNEGKPTRVTYPEFLNGVTAPAASYTYDLLKRVTNAVGTGGSTLSQTFGYDGFGNLTSKSVPAGSSEFVLPGVNAAKNWLNGSAYDADGNVTTLNNATLSYDVENRLSKYTTGTFVENYAYDEGNRRVEKWTSSGGDNVYFYGPGGKLLSVLNLSSSGTLSMVANRIYFGGMLLGSTTGYANSDADVIKDRLGSVQPGYAYGTDTGAGQQLWTGGDDFATYLKDGSSGFEYAMNRYYSASYGRFLTVDPFAGSAKVGNSGSWNRYSYGGGDPIGSSDPSGLDSVPCSNVELTAGGQDLNTTIGQAVNAGNDLAYLAITIFSEAGVNNTAEELAVGGTVLNRFAFVNGYYLLSNYVATSVQATVITPQAWGTPNDTVEGIVTAYNQFNEWSGDSLKPGPQGNLNAALGSSALTAAGSLNTTCENLLSAFLSAAQLLSDDEGLGGPLLFTSDGLILTGFNSNPGANPPYSWEQYIGRIGNGANQFYGVEKGQITGPIFPRIPRAHIPKIPGRGHGRGARF